MRATRTLAALLDPAKPHEVVFRPLRRLPLLRRVALPDDCLVSVVLVTNRVHQLDHAVRCFSSQTYPNKELILVTNSDDFPVDRLHELAAQAQITWLSTPAEMTLGQALNHGVASATGQVIAKFDDDDYYADHYLSTAVEAMRATGAGIVGKKTYYLYLEAADRTVRMYPGNEGRRVGRVAGGTIVAHRDVFDRIAFPAVNLGEDVRFVRAAERRGFGIYSMSARGFLQWRSHSGHTWDFDETEIDRVSDDASDGRDPTLWT